MPIVHHSDLVARLTALIGDLQRGRSGLQVGVEEIIDRAAESVPGAQYAGMTEISRTAGISTFAATNQYATLLDEIQQRHQEGPCASAAWRHHTVLIDDLDSETRWPHYRRDALAETPVRSILAFEVFVDSDVTGALNFYSEQVGAFDAESVELGTIFATHIALAWSVFRRTDQFRSALISRDIIGQAKGIVMERFRVDAIRAFELLNRLSQESNTKLVDVAQKIINTNDTGATDQPSV